MIKKSGKIDSKSWVKWTVAFRIKIITVLEKVERGLKRKINFPQFS